MSAPTEQKRGPERFNRFLDRALVVPTIGNDPELAFFEERP